MNTLRVCVLAAGLSGAVAARAGDLPASPFAGGTSGPRLPASPFKGGGWGLTLPRAVLIAKPPPDHLPRNLLAFDPEDETQHLVFLADDRPVVIRARVLVDGRGFRLAWGTFAHELYKYLDRNGDGVVTLKEANAGNAIQGFLSGGPFQRGTQNNANQAGPKLDEDKDDRVSFSELVAYLRPRSAPFSVQVGAGADARSEAAFAHLDKDRDRKLTRREVEEAELVLRRFDADEDEALTVAELGPFQGRFANQRRFATATAGAISTFPLRSGQPAAPIVAAMVARYDRPKDPANLASKDGKLAPEELKIDRATFDRADGNRDHLLDGAELARLLDELRPDLSLSMNVDLKTGRGIIDHVPSSGGSSTLDRKARKVGNDLVDLDLDAIKAAWKVQPTRKNPNGFDVRQFYLSTFHGADADGNNELDKKELTQAQFLNQIVGAADRNGDEKLKESELIAYIDLTDLSGWSRTTLTVSDLGRALFNHLDRDHDQRLGSREVRQAWMVLAGDDRDKDGRVSAKEIPRHFLLAFGRGQGNAQVFGFVDDGDEEEPTSTSPEPPAVAPRWFQRMDRNRDGDITPREFLGGPADFSRIDADHDGLISPAEASKAG